MALIKSIPKQETWSWQDDAYLDGETVRCVNHQFCEEERSFVSGSIAPGADHGWSTAASDYYYLIMTGSGVVEISADASHEASETHEIKAGESFVIKAGTTYNYRADADGLTFALFMNNLWDE